MPALRREIRETDEVLRRMRKGDGIMKPAFAFVLLIPGALFGAIEGTVINGTTGKPQPAVTVSLVQPGANGMQALATSTSDASGKFSIDHDLPPPPALLQADFKGVTYTQV